MAVPTVKYNDELGIKGMKLPSFRLLYAKQQGIKKALIFVSGGLGDAICAEPAIRWGLKTYGRQWPFTIITRWPELFQHLHLEAPVKIIQHVDEKMSDFEQEYICFNTLYTAETLHSEFLQPFNMNVVNYHALAMWRHEIPHYEKMIQLNPGLEAYNKVVTKLQSVGLNFGNALVIHPGKTWPSRTVPAKWWDDFNQAIIAKSNGRFIPVIIGTKNGGISTVNVNTNTECVDWRDELSIMETVALCQNVQAVVTNDSSPIHMAASSILTSIYFFATAKHPDYIKHVRGGVFGSRMYNMASGGLWTNYQVPEHGQVLHYDKCTDEQMKSWLPDPDLVADRVWRS